MEDMIQCIKKSSPLYGTFSIKNMFPLHGRYSVYKQVTPYMEDIQCINKIPLTWKVFSV